MELPPARARVHQARCEGLFKEAFLTRFAQLVEQAQLIPAQSPLPQQEPLVQEQAQQGYAMGKADAQLRRQAQLVGSESKYKTQLSGATL